jgi:hypothetical protein
MSEFVKICPRCGHFNPEYENLCAGCGHFIAMEPSVPRPVPHPVAPPTAAEPQAQAPEPPAAQAAQASVASPVLRLEPTAGGAPLVIQSLAVLGQDHPSGDAQVRLPLTLEGAAYVHRRHCRFLLEAGQWWVEPIDQAGLGGAFTNPTRLNGQEAPPGQRRPLRDGDELRLSGVALRVRLS